MKRPGVGKLRISGELIAQWFERGVNEAIPCDPLREVRVVDASLNWYSGRPDLVLTIESPDLPAVEDLSLIHI